MWQNEVGFLELFLAYFDQYKNSLAYGKKHRDFLVEILLCHERVIRHCGLVPGLTDYQTDVLDGMPILEPQVIVVEHCDDPENMGSDMVVTKMERVPHECESPAVFSLELPFKGAVEEDGQHGLRVDQKTEESPVHCKTEITDDEETHAVEQMDSRSDADIDAEEQPSMWEEALTPKQEVEDTVSDDVVAMEESEPASKAPDNPSMQEKLTWFPPTSLAQTDLESEDECDNFEGPNCQDQPPIYSQVSSDGSVVPATQRQPLFASMQGHRLDLYRQMTSTDNQGTDFDRDKGIAQTAPADNANVPAQPEVQLPTGNDLNRMVNDLCFYVSTNAAKNMSQFNNPPPVKKPTLHASVAYQLNGVDSSLHGQGTTDYPLPPGIDLSLRANDNTSRACTATPSTSPAVDHSISSAPETPSPPPPPAPSLPTSTAAATPVMPVRQEFQTANNAVDPGSRPVNSLSNTMTTSTPSDPQSRRSYICSRCRRLFRSYELFTRHPCIIAFTQDPVNGRTSGLAGQTPTTNIFPNRDVFATKLQHERYQQHIQNIIHQQLIQRHLQQRQQPVHSFQQQSRVSQITQEHSLFQQLPVPDERQQLPHHFQTLQQIRSYPIQTQEQQIQPSYRLADQTQKQVQRSQLNPSNQPLANQPQQQPKQCLTSNNQLQSQNQANPKQQEQQLQPPSHPQSQPQPQKQHPQSQSQSPPQPQLQLQLQPHQEEERSPNTFHCRMCKRSFCRAGDRMRHERTHASNRRCQWCGKEFSRPSSMRYHESKCSLKPPEPHKGHEHSPPLLVSRARVV